MKEKKKHNGKIHANHDKKQKCIAITKPKCCPVNIQEMLCNFFWHRVQEFLKNNDSDALHWKIEILGHTKIRSSSLVTLLVIMRSQEILIFLIFSGK